MGDSVHLPPPGGLLEISFRRLLLKCESLLVSSSQDNAEDPRTSPAFHHYVETLQEQLTDFANSPVNRVVEALLAAYRECVDALAQQLNAHSCAVPCNRVDEALLAAYRERVDALAQQLKAPNVPAFCLAPVQQTEAMASLQEALQRAASNSLFQRKGAAVDSAGPSDSNGSHADNRQTDAAPGRAVLTQATQARLQTHMTLQENLTDELVGLARHLKRTAQAFGGALQNRESLLDDADTTMTTNLANARKVAADAKTVHRKSRVNFCTTCLVLMMVGLVFAGMYMFIKVTSFVGYKRARQVASDYARQALKRRKTSHVAGSVEL